MCPGPSQPSSICVPTPQRHQAVLPPGLPSYCSSTGMPLFTTLQVSGPDPVLCQSPQRCIVIICLVCALGGQRWGHLGHCCVPRTKEAAICSLPKCTPHPHPLWVSPPTDQNPGKDSEAWVPNSEERLILREEFTTRMHQYFLDGKDGDFDYRCSRAPHPCPPTQHPTALGCMPDPRYLHGGPPCIVLGDPEQFQAVGPGVSQRQGFRSTKDQCVTLD